MHATITQMKQLEYVMPYKQMKYLQQAKTKSTNPCSKSTIKAIGFFFFNWDSHHAGLNSHYAAWSYWKTKHKKITAYRKSF